MEQKLKKYDGKNRGITLIALVITIIVMLILVSVTISMAVNGGLFNYAGDAAKRTNEALKAEQDLANGGIEIDGVLYDSIDDYLNGETATKTGSYISANDVSQTQHNLKVNLTSDTLTEFSSINVYRYGSNLLDISKMLNENLIDNNDGTYTFTRNSTTQRFSEYYDIFIPAGVPVVVSVNTIEGNIDTFNAYFEFDDGTTDYMRAADTTTETFDKNIVKFVFMVSIGATSDGDYITFSEPRLNIGKYKTYSDYIVPQVVSAKSDGNVSGLTSLSPDMSLLTDSDQVEIVCEYKKKQ